MLPTMTTHSAGQPADASRGGGMGGRVSSGGGRNRGRSGDQGDGRIDGQGGQVGGQGSEEFLASNPKEYDGKGGDIVLSRGGTLKSTHEEERSLKNYAMVEAGHAAYTDRFHELARTIQKAVQIAGTLTGEALRNGSIKKNLEKRGNRGEPSKDRNVRDDNKRTRTGNAFATTVNPIRGRYTGSETRGNHQNQVVAVNGGQGRGNLGNQARGKAFMLGAEEARQDPNIVMGTFTLNDHYSTTLFNSSADYSFVSTTFIPLLGIEPNDLGFSYEI
ncbi:hypothetical protein Tco_1464456 [Tanacetum coccineum]